MAQKSLAAVSIGSTTTELREFDIPDIDANSGLLEIEAAGICGSDWQMYQGAGPQRILGHENIGHVVKLGRLAARNWKLKEGDRIALEEYLPCGQCAFCRSSDFRLCPDTETRGDSFLRYGVSPITMPPALWGGYSRFMYLHPRSVIHRIDEKTPAHLLAMAIPMSNGIQWVQYEAGLRMGQSILIQGPGQQGLAAVLAARRLGAKRVIVSGLTRDAPRLDVARKFGATDIVDVERENLVGRIMELTGGAGVDAVLDVAAGPNTLVDGLKSVAKSGVVVFAVGKPIFNFPADLMTARRINLKAARGHSFQAVETALELISSGDYPVELMATHQFGLNEVDLAIRSVGGQGAPGAIHVSVIPSRPV